MEYHILKKIFCSPLFSTCLKQALTICGTFGTPVAYSGEFSVWILPCRDNEDVSNKLELVFRLQSDSDNESELAAL